MKITKIDIMRHKNSAGNFVFCRVHTDAGIYGDGEVGNITSCSASFGALKDAAAMVIGMNPLRPEAIWEHIYKDSFWGQNGGPMTFSAISAIDVALWDIRGKYYKVPVYKLLGGKFRSKIRCYASQLQLNWAPIYAEESYKPAATIEDYVRNTKAALEEGYDAIKIDFFSWDEDGKRFPRDIREHILHPVQLKLLEDRLRAVRETAGHGVQIIIENHSRLDMPGAIQWAKAAEKYDIMYFEEPNTPQSYTAAYIESKINIPQASGERIYSRWQYVPYFRDQSLQVIQPDICCCGGITETKKICDMAHPYDISVQIHTCGSPLATNIGLHMEAAIPNFMIHEHHALLRLKCMEGLTKYNIHPVNGYLDVPEEPGLGNEFTQAAYDRAIEVFTVDVPGTSSFSIKKS